MAYYLKIGGTTVGTELLYVLPAGERMSRPLEDNPVGFDTAVLTEIEPGVIWRPRFVLWHEEADMWTFAKWLHACIKRFRDGKQDATVYEDSTLKITYPQCALVNFSRPRPRDPAEAHFCAEIDFDFVTDQDPY